MSAALVKPCVMISELTRGIARLSHPCNCRTQRKAHSCAATSGRIMGGAQSLARHPGGVSELADEHDLGSCAARRGGSSPPFPTREPAHQTAAVVSGISPLRTPERSSIQDTSHSAILLWLLPDMAGASLLLPHMCKQHLSDQTVGRRMCACGITTLEMFSSCPATLMTDRTATR